MATKNYPLYVMYRLPVVCNGYFAGVTVKGRVLLSEEANGEFWAYGVNPGGICAEGDSVKAAMAAFYQEFSSCLFDLAGDGKDIRGFRAAVTRFFNGTNVPYERDWMKARQDVRAGKIDLAGALRETAEETHFIKVVEIKAPMASDNPTGAGELRLAVPSKAA